MFLVVGKGQFLKDNLISKLSEWGIENPLSVIKGVEKNRSARCGKYTIMLVM